MKYMVRAEGLTKQYGDFLAVKGIDFSVLPGEIYGFLGPNGAGKTSTINMLTGLARISKGRAIVAGYDVGRSPVAVKAHIGVVPDESNLYDDLNGFDNLCFCGALYGLRRAVREARARELLEQFNLTAAGIRPFKAYSKGMKRKLTIAAALIHRPPLLFLDEPTTGIDVASAREVRRLLVELNKSGTTIFLTTHYIEEAERLCTRIALLVEGRVVKIGTPLELISCCRTGYTIELKTGRPPGNYLEEMSRQFPDFTITSQVRSTTLQAQAATSHVHINEDLESDNEAVIRLTTSSKKAIDIAPLVSWLHQKGLSVLEARVIKPSLEEAFVTLTNIGVQTMKKEIEKGEKGKQ
jgi:ABC-2 type transport system ATP-binding protein